MGTVLNPFHNLLSFFSLPPVTNNGITAMGWYPLTGLKALHDLGSTVAYKVCHTLLPKDDAAQQIKCIPIKVVKLPQKTIRVLNQPLRTTSHTTRRNPTKKQDVHGLFQPNPALPATLPAYPWLDRSPRNFLQIDPGISVTAAHPPEKYTQPKAGITSLSNSIFSVLSSKTSSIS
jgi:hypothetical protein